MALHPNASTNSGERGSLGDLRDAQCLNENDSLVLSFVPAKVTFSTQFSHQGLKLASRAYKIEQIIHRRIGLFTFYLWCTFDTPGCENGTTIQDVEHYSNPPLSYYQPTSGIGSGIQPLTAACT